MPLARSFTTTQQVWRPTTPWVTPMVEMPVREVEPEVAEIDFTLWQDLLEEPEAGTMQCIKTQKRRDLKMKKHRRAKRKKVMLLKLKSSGKI